MTKKKEVKTIESIPAWVHGKGLKDIDGLEIEPGSYAYVKKILKGMQAANTDPLELIHPKTYNTRQIKAKK